MAEIKAVPLGAGQDVGRSCIIVTLGKLFFNVSSWIASVKHPS